MAKPQMKLCAKESALWLCALKGNERIELLQICRAVNVFRPRGIALVKKVN
jgi:hypothetical protein